MNNNSIKQDELDHLKLVISKAVHSCNNHLSTVMTSCDLITLKHTGDIADKAGVIKSRCRLMADQLKGLRKVSALSDEDDIIDHNLHLLCNNLTERLMQACNSEYILVENSVSSDLSIKAGTNLIETALEELIKNSLQSLNRSDIKDKKIFFSSDNLADRMVIKISDNGPAIDDDVKNIMFTPFYSSNKSEVGLGLALVKHAMYLMNGHVFFERQNGWNTFKLEFNKGTY